MLIADLGNHQNGETLIPVLLRAGAALMRGIQNVHKCDIKTGKIGRPLSAREDRRTNGERRALRGRPEAVEGHLQLAWACLRPARNGTGCLPMARPYSLTEEKPAQLVAALYDIFCVKDDK